MKKVLLLSCLGLLISCGRSHPAGADLTHVALGLASQAGESLSRDAVQASLDVLDFSLTSFSSKQVCQAGSCHWQAEGSLPAYHVDLLPSFEDQVLKVVFARVQQPAPRPESVPTR